MREYNLGKVMFRLAKLDKGINKLIIISYIQIVNERYAIARFIEKLVEVKA